MNFIFIFNFWTRLMKQTDTFELALPAQWWTFWQTVGWHFVDCSRFGRAVPRWEPSFLDPAAPDRRHRTLRLSASSSGSHQLGHTFPESWVRPVTHLNNKTTGSPRIYQVDQGSCCRFQIFLETSGKAWCVRFRTRFWVSREIHMSDDERWWGLTDGFPHTTAMAG